MRRWMHRALLVLAFCAALPPTAGYAQQPEATPGSPFAQPPDAAPAGPARPPDAAAPQPDPTAVLAAAALTEADLPAGLTLDGQRSGPRPTEDGVRSYVATFVGNGRGELPIMGVVNILNAYPDGGAGIDQLTDRFRTGLGGTPVDLEAPRIGEASRAFTVTRSAMGGAMTANTIFVAIRRGDVVAGVAVMAVGATPQTDVALRLAQNVDRRLTAAPRPGP
jgi:hypothetical protein